MAGLTTLPDGSRYSIAVQSPAVTFRDPRLKAARVATDKHGYPVASSGGFAVAYRFEGPGQAWAVRCFTRLSAGLEQRYQQVSSFLAAHASPHWLPIEFHRDGMLVERNWWPITVMPWVDAQPLNDWVAARLRDPGVLGAAADRFERLAADLDRLGVAHGDLQHGNVLVRPDGTFVLIDYDGMYVPALAGQPMPEMGHPHYQHPRRGTAAFGPRLDRFSMAVIWSALRVLAVQPHLWDLFDIGENLLFTSRDFADPSRSELFMRLRAHHDAAQLAQRIEALLSVSVDRLPTLGEFVRGAIPEPDEVVVNFGPVAPFPIVDLRRRRTLDSRQGQRITAVGEILDLSRGRTYRGDPYLHLTIGSKTGDRMKVVLWSEALGRLTQAQGSSLQIGALVGATGTLSSWQGQTQIVLERPALLEVLGPARLLDLVGSKWSEPPPPETVTRSLQVGDVVEHATFGQGVIVRVQGDVADVRFATEEKRIQYTTFPLRFIRRPPAAKAQATPGTGAPAKPPAATPTPPSGKAAGPSKHTADWEGLLAMSGAAAPVPAAPAPGKPSASVPAPNPPDTAIAGGAAANAPAPSSAAAPQAARNASAPAATRRRRGRRSLRIPAALGVLAAVLLVVAGGQSADVASILSYVSMAAAALGIVLALRAL